jgi:hypothetical protein
MRVLILEDRGSVFNYMAEALGNEGHTVITALSISDAKSAFSIGNIDCIICDINMSMDGLTTEEKKQTFAGLLSGWVWLKHYVINKNPEMRKRIIIYTDYLSDLKLKVPDEELAGITLIAKRSGDGSAELLFKCVDNISKDTRASETII